MHRRTNKDDAESVMKKIIITLSIIIAAVLFSTPSFAQKALTVPSDVNALVPGMTLRPLSKSESACLTAVKAMNITACSTATVGAVAAVGAIAYSVESKEAEGKGESFARVAEYDKKVCKSFITTAGVSFGLCAVSAFTSITLKASLRGKTIVRASTGGFVIEF